MQFIIAIISFFFAPVGSFTLLEHAGLFSTPLSGDARSAKEINERLLENP